MRSQLLLPTALFLAMAVFASQASAQSRDMRPPLPADATGPEIYRSYCSFCHDDGTLGAPIVGDADAWRPRAEKGIDALTHSAWDGHNLMPARSLRTELAPGQVQKAVEYILSRIPR